MKKGPRRHKNTPEAYVAVFDRVEEKRSKRTPSGKQIHFKDIKTPEGKWIASHQWFDHGAFADLGALNKGDLVRFMAKSKEVETAGVRGPQIGGQIPKDVQLYDPENPTRVETQATE